MAPGYGIGECAKVTKMALREFMSEHEKETMVAMVVSIISAEAIVELISYQRL